MAQKPYLREDHFSGGRPILFDENNNINIGEVVPYHLKRRWLFAHLREIDD